MFISYILFALLLEAESNYYKIDSLIKSGDIQNSKGNDLDALKYYEKALGLSEEIGVDSLVFYSKRGIGGLLLSRQNSDGIKVMGQCIVLALKLNKPKLLISIYQQIALYYSGLANTNIDATLFDSSLMYHQKTQDVLDVLDPKDAAKPLVGYYNNLSTIYTSKNYPNRDILKGVSLLKKAQEVINKYGLPEEASIYINIGDSYENKFNETLKNTLLDSALLYYQKGLDVSDSLHQAYPLRIALISLASVYEKKEDLKTSVDYYNKYYEHYDSTKSQVLDLVFANFKMQQEKKEQEIAAADNHKEKNEKFIKNASLGGLILLVALIIIIVVTRAAIKQKKLALEIFDQNQLLEEQQSIINQKNEDIGHSIRYALKIQKAMAMSFQEVKNTIGDSFVFFQPKEEVSGDFYFVHKAKDDKVIIAVADCKSHGLPGAFMGMLGSSLLREAVVQDSLKSPELILETVGESIRRSLRQENDSIFKGIELSVCVLDRKSGNLSYSGAFSSMYVVKNGILCELKGERDLVGYSSSGRNSFSKHIEPSSEGACIYLFTDGFIDQFGGSSGKKYKAPSFRNKLCAIHKQSMNQQLKTLKKEFDTWKGSEEQVDDVTIIGIRV